MPSNLETILSNYDLGKLQDLADELNISRYENMDEDTLTTIISNIISNKFTVYTLEGCPYCIKSKDLLRSFNFPFSEIIVHRQDKDEIKRQFNHKSFPIIYDNKGEFIGGYQDLQNKYADGCVIS